MRIFIIIIFFIVVNCNESNAQRIDKNYLKTIVKTLTTDSMQGRYPGTRGIERAANYIEQSFHNAGITNVRREEFTLIEKGYEQIYLRSGDKKFYCPNDIMLQGSIYTEAEIEKQLVFAGRGTKDELESIDVKDRIVLVFLPNVRASYDLARQLEKRQAVALIVANPDNAAQFESISKGFANYVMSKRMILESWNSKLKMPGLDTMKTIATFIIRNEMIPVMMNTSMKHLLKSVDERKLADIPVSTIALNAEFKERPVRTSNIIAHLQGLSDSTIVVSAHYDHIGESDNGIFHGADDNASGTAGMISLAKKFSSEKSMHYSMTFLAASGEEEGMLGSIYHTTTSDFNPGKIICNLNIDMVGSNDPKHQSKGRYIYVIGYSNPVPMNDLIERAAEINHIALDYSQSGAMGFFQRSDQFSFYRRGIPAIHFFSGEHDRYHKQRIHTTHSIIRCWRFEWIL